MPPRHWTSAAPVSSWDSLPVETVTRVLAHLYGDVRTLCAAACVSRAWRDAAAEQTLWACPRLRPRLAERLTDERLAALVKRARGSLRCLDVSGAWQITDAGLLAALQQAHAVSEFCADAFCRRLTARGVARALEAQRGRMALLCVDGLDCGQAPPADSGLRAAAHAFHTACATVVKSLGELLEPGGNLEGDKVCYGEGEDGWCQVLCDRSRLCEDCALPFCEKRHGKVLRRCAECDKLLCGACRNGKWCMPCRCRRRLSEEEGSEPREDLYPGCYDSDF